MKISFQSIPLHSISEDSWGISAFPKSFRAITWNLLAPCWKRTSYGRESDSRTEWEYRLNCSTEQILQTESDIICIQELWFDEEYIKLFTDVFSEKYHIFTLQRVHKKPDGLAILIKKNTFPKPQAQGFDFYDFGSRVGLMLVWDSLILLNIHLTFPHNNQYDRKIRLSQALDIKEILENHHMKTQIVVGDFNGSIHDEAVSRLMSEAILYPMINHSNFVTHVSHRGDEMACDLFLSSINSFTDVLIHPIDLSLSDHCIVQAQVHVPMERE